MFDWFKKWCQGDSVSDSPDENPLQTPFNFSQPGGSDDWNPKYSSASVPNLSCIETPSSGPLFSPYELSGEFATNAAGCAAEAKPPVTLSTTTTDEPGSGATGADHAISQSAPPASSGPPPSWGGQSCTYEIERRIKSELSGQLEQRTTDERRDYDDGMFERFGQYVAIQIQDCA
jgi:hypothetical protein